MIKEFIVNEQDKIVVNYNAFLGIAVISYNGKQAQKISKNTFKLTEGEKTLIFNLRGGMFGGLSLDYEGKSFKVLDPISWYVYVLGFMPFIMTMVLSNMPTLVKAGFYYVGGAIGGAISGLFSVLGIALTTSTDKKWLKILYLLASIAVTFLICFGIGNLIVVAKTK